ncbi:Tetracycline resistance protein TetA/multidrug resistance protein MdtG [Penicillium paradoxum]|uniref:Tetracycline resistance protein TetA/multidrug resistance protein MdtG n=1 Tax=Penicillium paradoxum TaxID=176176 RepID=UPI0025468918|nr:Tetracycline resistance protein TetA/multidrug resistance protein MdtG [Penicillium paradoxum]KAJ5780516.1 Tetracycline resistance protein TetA/multidrug resistance protein MdtG [Penicillium paradoxum]
MEGDTKPWGYTWRSSRFLVVSSITVALFAETFLYGFLTPILGYMLEERLHLDPSRTQTYTTSLLTTHGFIGLISAPIVAHIAEKTPSQKTPLLIALAGCFAGTLMIALAPYVWVLFLGRILQSAAGSATWVVGFALLANNVDKKHLGKSMGMAMSFVTAGMVAGPTVSGTLLQLFGYWAAWSLPLVVLLLDIIARLIMIEPAKGLRKTKPSSKPAGTSILNSDGAPEESTALLSDSSAAIKPDDAEMENKPDLKHEYYTIMLTNPRVLTSLSNIVVVSSLMSGINNTLPVHLRQAFGWKSLLISMMFFCLQVPNIALSGPAGWLRDHIGLRGPTVFGWVASIPPLLLMGLPGDRHFPWAGSDAAGKSIFTTSLIGLGAVLPLVRGAGAVQLAYVAKDMEAKDPHVFEANRSNLRVFSMTEVAYGLGMMFGPLLTGSMFELVGFFWMTIALAIICLIQAVVSWLWLDPLPSPETPEVSV